MTIEKYYEIHTVHKYCYKRGQNKTCKFLFDNSAVITNRGEIKLGLLMRIFKKKLFGVFDIEIHSAFLITFPSKRLAQMMSWIKEKRSEIGANDLHRNDQFVSNFI